MGYAGYAPGKYAPPKPTEVQAALRQVARQDSYELLSKLLRNVVRPSACVTEQQNHTSMSGETASSYLLPLSCSRKIDCSERHLLSCWWSTQAWLF